MFVFIFQIQIPADGCYVSYSESVAVSADQRAILIKGDDNISMTFSTAYTGDGTDFGWVIPVPVIPETENVFEAGEAAVNAFSLLDEISAPLLFYESGSRGGCFPAGTEVKTPDGTVPIERIKPGTKIISYDFNRRRWVEAEASRLILRQYNGEFVTIALGETSLQSTANHPFLVIDGRELDSRPVPADIGEDEDAAVAQGRWVQAKDLRAGDLLMTVDGGGLRVTGLASHIADAVVYNLAVEDYCNYTVCRAGVLVHNKGAQESSDSGIDTNLLVRVHGNVILENYEISILEAYDAGVLLSWLERRGYHADNSAVEIFEYYINKGWSFVAVKLNPEKGREYENEFLPPLTVSYQNDRLVFPLKISSVSSGNDVRISLFVVSDGTVGSSNYEIVDYQYPEDARAFDPEIDWDKYMKKTLSSVNDRGLVWIWRGRVDENIVLMNYINKLLRDSSSLQNRLYLSRLDTIISPEMMEDDIDINFSRRPQYLQIEINARPYSALMEAIERGDEEKVGELLAGGYNPDSAQSMNEMIYGKTPLPAAASEGSSGIVKMLIEAGADVDYRRSSRHKTALYYAVERGYKDIVRLLIDAGADVNTAWETHYYSGSGKYIVEAHTLLAEAMSHGYMDIVGMLKAAGAEGGVIIDSGHTELSENIFEAASGGDADRVRLLLETGASVNMKDLLGYTALMWAAMSGSADTVKLLLDAGADVDMMNNYGSTALMRAAQNGYEDIVMLLLESDADAGIRNNLGETAGMLASENGFADIARLLDEEGE